MMKICTQTLRPAVLPLVFCFLPLVGMAQQVSDVIVHAEHLWAAGQYVEAGEQFELAGRLKTDRPVLLYKAAEAYYRGKEYGRAADCYRLLRDKPEEFELAGLRYARALKQAGQYPEAQLAFRKYFQDYHGGQKALLEQVINNDIAGCELAMRLGEAAGTTPLAYEAQRLPAPVNTAGNEFAPMLFNDNVLYFSVAGTAGSPAILWRSEHPEDSWQAPVEARGLPPEAAIGFSSGVFTPDGNRFYCAQCTERKPADWGESASASRPHCDILVLRQQENGWSKPEPLRGYINLPGFTTLAPAVAHDGEREYLFFASDRSGGSGGLDLYVCERPLGADDLDFSLPRNLGPSINTGGDETTPYFDVSRRVLYFSSNGQISLGGFDVFKTQRSGTQWTAPENLGLPFNSPADDQWFVPKSNGKGGFVSSNRSFGTEKPGTRDEDIFELSPVSVPLFLSGEIIDDASGAWVNGCLVSLFEHSPDGEISLVQIQPSPDGRFRFRLLPGSSYTVEAVKEGYRTARATLGAPNQTAEGYTISLLLHREVSPPPDPVVPRDLIHKE